MPTHRNAVVKSTHSRNTFLGRFCHWVFHECLYFYDIDICLFYALALCFDHRNFLVFINRCWLHSVRRNAKNLTLPSPKSTYTRTRRLIQCSLIKNSLSKNMRHPESRRRSGTSRSPQFSCRTGVLTTKANQCYT